MPVDLRLRRPDWAVRGDGHAHPVSEFPPGLLTVELLVVGRPADEFGGEEYGKWLARHRLAAQVHGDGVP